MTIYFSSMYSFIDWLIDWFVFPFLCSVYRRSQWNSTHHQQHTRVDWWWEEGQQKKKGDFADTTTTYLVCAIWYSPVKCQKWVRIDPEKNNGIGCAEIRLRDQSEPAPTSAPAQPFACRIVVAGKSAQVTLNS